MNAIKEAIKSGKTVVGTTVTPNVDVSILADAGYDSHRESLCQWLFLGPRWRAFQACVTGSQFPGF